MHSQWHVPETHYLETWSDARTGDGTVTVCQPLIEPLYECRSAHEIVAALAGETKTPLEIVQGFWKANWEGRAAGAFGKLTDPTGVDFASFEKFWRRVLHDGYVPGTAFAPKTVALAAGGGGRSAGRAPSRPGSRSRSTPIRRSTTAASPTTAGCRSCPSRSTRSAGTTSPTSARGPPNRSA